METFRCGVSGIETFAETFEFIGVGVLDAYADVDHAGADHFFEHAVLVVAHDGVGAHEREPLYAKVARDKFFRKRFIPLGIVIPVFVHEHGAAFAVLDGEQFDFIDRVLRTLGTPSGFEHDGTVIFGARVGHLEPPGAEAAIAHAAAAVKDGGAARGKKETRLAVEVHGHEVISRHGQGVEVLDECAGRGADHGALAAEGDSFNGLWVVAISHRAHEFNERYFSFAQHDKIHAVAGERLFHRVAEMRAAGDGDGFGADFLGYAQGAKGFVRVDRVVLAHAHEIGLLFGNLAREGLPANFH